MKATKALSAGAAAAAFALLRAAGTHGAQLAPGATTIASDAVVP